ncbi:MAG TPA: vanadium-dependent haloperoxidase [Alphaproteobacteria bacterium]|nr:vanadium-dependent haloperoxidase [Alphaproteobacteria bacterium]
MKKTIYGLILVTMVIFLTSCSQERHTTYHTYFDYSEQELKELESLDSKNLMATQDLYKWDAKAFDLVATYTLKEDFSHSTAKIYAYLAVAQRDAAYISFNEKGKFAGSLDPVSKEVLCLFFEDDCSDLEADSDEYSNALAKIVVAKVKDRIKEDSEMLTPYTIKDGGEYWNGPQPSIGLSEGSSKTWVIESGSQFRVPPPPSFDSEEFKEQVAITKAAVGNVTVDQKRKVVFWAGGPGTKTPPGQWLEIADDYMKKENTDFEKAINVRALLTMSICDANIAVLDSKYTHLVKRPFMMDSSILTVMPTPNHPSYPAGHSTLSGAAGTVLIHFFPEAKSEWEILAEEGGVSRVWGGIHYMMDHEQGKILGEKIAQEGLKQIEHADEHDDEH